MEDGAVEMLWKMPPNIVFDAVSVAFWFTGPQIPYTLQALLIV